MAGAGVGGGGAPCRVLAEQAKQLSDTAARYFSCADSYYYGQFLIHEKALRTCTAETCEKATIEFGITFEKWRVWDAENQLPPPRPARKKRRPA
jgi:hypothetical protein